MPTLLGYAGQLLCRKLAQQFVDLIAAVGQTPQQRHIYQLGKYVDSCARHLPGSLCRRPAPEYRQAHEYLARGRAQPAPRVQKHRTEIALAGGHVRHVGLQKSQVPPDLCCDFGRRKHARPGRSQQDAERYAVHEAADLYDSCHVAFAGLIARMKAAGMQQEQLHGRIRQRIGRFSRRESASRPGKSRFRC